MTTKVSDTLTIKIGEVDRELFMSFGLLNELTSIIRDPARIPAVTLETDLRNQFLSAILAERKKSGKIVNPVEIDDIEITYEDAERAMAWGQEHVMDFFIRSFRQISRVTEAHEQEVTSLTSSLGGSKSSASKKPSSSPQG